jgi:type II secretory pathway component GspD/PulD (secretin)
MPTTHRTPHRFTALDTAGVMPGRQTIDLEVNQAPLRDIVQLFAMTLDTPMWVDPSIDAAVNIKAERTPALDALDEALAQGGAIRTEVAALHLVGFGGRTDTAQFGGDAISLQMRDAPVDDVLRAIEAKLYMPIGHVDSKARVSIDVHDMPAGAALEWVLAQAKLGWEPTTGFAITPDGED